MIKKEEQCVILDNGHGIETAGKRSPDGSLREYKWTREMVDILIEEFSKLGIKTIKLVPEENDISLRERVKRVNNIYKDNKNCILISIHCNAAGSGDKWCNARGWSVFVAKNASNNSKRLAKLIYEEVGDLKGNRCVPSEKYWVASLAMCRDTKCPAVLTENLFQDNKEDVKILLSDEGKQKIAKIHVNGVLKYYG